MIIKELFLEINKLVGADFDVLECRINNKIDNGLCFSIVWFRFNKKPINIIEIK